MHQPRETRRFGRLIVKHVQEYSTRQDGDHYYLCQCDCGNTKVVKWKNLIRGSTKSCGCLASENLAALKKIGEANRQAKQERYAKYLADQEEGFINGASAKKHPLWTTYRSMIVRCTRPKKHNYKSYGGKGITVCDRWLDGSVIGSVRGFKNFLADMGNKPSTTHTLDRIDSAGNYEPGNCRWATRAEQLMNTSSFRQPYLGVIKGKRVAVSDFARKFNLNSDKIKEHIKSGMRPEKAMFLVYCRKQAWLRGERIYTACDAEADKLVAKYCD